MTTDKPSLLNVYDLEQITRRLFIWTIIMNLEVKTNARNNDAESERYLKRV